MPQNPAENNTLPKEILYPICSDTLMNHIWYLNITSHTPTQKSTAKWMLRFPGFIHRSLHLGHTGVVPTAAHCNAKAGRGQGVDMILISSGDWAVGRYWMTIYHHLPMLIKGEKNQPSPLQESLGFLRVTQAPKWGWPREPRKLMFWVYQPPTTTSH